MTARKALRKLAKQNGVTVKEIRADIEEAIRIAWCCDNAAVIASQRQVPCIGHMPTPEELITYVAHQVLQAPNDRF